MPLKVTGVPVDALKFAVGFHEYVFPPVEDRVVLTPLQMVPEPAVAVIVGSALTLTLVVVGLVRLPEVLQVPAPAQVIVQ